MIDQFILVRNIRHVVIKKGLLITCLTSKLCLDRSKFVHVFPLCQHILRLVCDIWVFVTQMHFFWVVLVRTDRLPNFIYFQRQLHFNVVHLLLDFFDTNSGFWFWRLSFNFEISFRRLLWFFNDQLLGRSIQRLVQRGEAVLGSCLSRGRALNFVLL